MRVTVVAVGRLRPPFVDDAEHYRRRLRPYVRLDEVELRDDAGEEQVGRRVPERAHCVLLDVTGRAMDSPAGAPWLEERRASGRDLCFALGGACGLALARADERLSFGPITLPHQLARVVLYEQLYRWHRILRGEPYHH